MAINFDLLDAAINDAATEANGFKHQQNDWVSLVDDQAESAELCSTAMCLAGFIAVRTGAEVPPVLRDNRSGRWYRPSWFVDPETGAYAADGGIEVRYWAEERAGLTYDQASWLFQARNSLDLIRAMRDYLYERPDAGSDELAEVEHELTS